MDSDSYIVLPMGSNFMVIFITMITTTMMTLDKLIVGYFGRRVSPSISGSIEYGSRLAITGSNGTGKSTILKTFAGFLPPVSGKLNFNEKGRPSLGYLPQIKNIDYHIPLTVFDVVSMGCWPETNLFKKLSYHQKNIIYNSLEQLNLLNLLDKNIDSLSGGQIQCMLFARIVVQKASLILLDEPFQGIDEDTCDIIMNMINRLSQHGCTIIAVLHNRKIVTKYFTKILLLTHSYSIWRSSICCI